MIKERLSKLHTEIRETRIDILEAQEQYERNQEWLKKWELKNMEIIASATDAAGKALYSNDVKRQAALEAEKEQSEEYSLAIEKKKKLARTIKEMEIEISCLCDEQSNLRAICRLGGEE